MKVTNIDIWLIASVAWPSVKGANQKASYFPLFHPGDLVFVSSSVVTDLIKLLIDCRLAVLGDSLHSCEAESVEQNVNVAM
jgi:hypothetical protein